MDPRAGAHVDDIVGMADRILVMLDDEHRVAEVAKALQRREQPVVVALVETDRRLVKDVEHARQSAADLAGEADALALAAAERARGAVEVEIVEPDIVEEAEPLVDLFQDRLGDLLLLVVQLLLERAEPVERIGDAAPRRLADVRSEEHTSELQSLMRISYAVFCLKKKK